MDRIPELVTEISIWAVPILFAIIIHEVMHGVVARMLGDDTASRAGRLTLNPLAHIDPFGTVILPALLLFMHLPMFGYAKPVPVNFGRLRNPRTGMILVAAAGPLTNLTLAFLSSVALRILIGHLDGPGGHTIVYPLALMMRASVMINVALAVFNLLPLAAARRFARIERYGFLILLLLLYTDTVDRLINPVIRAIAGAML